MSSRLKTHKLKETPQACPPGATILDAEFMVVRPGRRSRRKRSWLLLWTLAVFAAAVGGMAGMMAPAMLAQLWTVAFG